MSKSLQPIALALLALLAPVLIAAGPGGEPVAASEVRSPAPGEMPMDWTDRRDFDFAERGIIATRSDPAIRDGSGRVVLDLADGAFLDDPGISTVHSSLLRQARLHRMSGLFQVVDGVYQVRGFDATNVTFVLGKTGWIVINPTVTAATSRAALDIVIEHLGQRPVKAVIYTHTHPDHFGGVEGIVSPADATVTTDRQKLAALTFSPGIPLGVEISGSRGVVEAFTDWFANPQDDFPIIWREDAAVE